MDCPVCLNRLSYLRIVEKSATYECSCTQGVWTRDGIYHGDDISKDCLDSCSLAIGSSSRKLWVTSLKKDENRFIFKTRWGGLYMRYAYDTNEKGIITGRRMHFEIKHLSKKHGMQPYVFWVSRLTFHIKKFKDLLTLYNRSESEFVINRLKMFFENQDKKWWQRAARVYFKVFYRSLYKSLKNK